MTLRPRLVLAVPILCIEKKVTVNVHCSKTEVNVFKQKSTFKNRNQCSTKVIKNIFASAKKHSTTKPLKLIQSNKIALIT